MKKIKLIVINLIFFLTFLVTSEVLFSFCIELGLIKKKEKTFNFEDENLNRYDAEVIYGKNIFNVPEKYNSRFENDFYFIKDGQIDVSLKYSLFKALQNSEYPIKLNIKMKLLPPYDTSVLYDVEYKINRFGRRVVENQKDKIKTNKYILALGDSYTFGEGVNSGMDYPSQLAKKIDNSIRVYNFGMPSMGSNDLLYQLQNKPVILNEVVEKNGIAFWYFINQHYERFLCTLRCYQTKYDEYIYAKPLFELKGSELVYKGRFENNLNFKRLVLKSLGQSTLLRHSGVVNPYSEDDFRSIASSFAEIEKILQNKINLKKLYVIIPPKIHQKKQLIDHLKNNQIDILDISSIPIEELRNSTIPIDLHPTSNYYWMLSEVIKNFIFENNVFQ